MKRAKWIGIGFIGIILILGFTLYFKMQRALPSYGESLTYPELQGVVEIHTDSYGNHISLQTPKKISTLVWDTLREGRDTSSCKFSNEWSREGFLR
jgi:hypothetical protein